MSIVLSIVKLKQGRSTYVPPRRKIKFYRKMLSRLNLQKHKGLRNTTNSVPVFAVVLIARAGFRLQRVTSFLKMCSS